MADFLKEKIRELKSQGLSGIQIIEALRKQNIVVPLLIVRQILIELEG